jgi:hypothetical protein
MMPASLPCWKFSVGGHTEVSFSLRVRIRLLTIRVSVLIQSAPPSNEFLGMVSDRTLLTWFYQFAQETPSLSQFLSIPLHHLSLPSLNINLAVVAARSGATVLDAMKLMSEQGVGSIAVVDDELGNLLSAVSVTDIGKVSVILANLMSISQSSVQIVVPSQSNQILSTPLHQFIWFIKASAFPQASRSRILIEIISCKAPDGSTDGVDKYPGMYRNR